MTANDREDDGIESRSGTAERDDTGVSDGLGRRQWLGLAALAGGVVLLVAAGAHPLLGSDNRLLIVGIATVTVILGLFSATDRRITTGRFWDPPDPEPGTRVPVPGESFERLPDRKLRARIRERAIVSLCDATDRSRETAEQRLADGTWTGDGLAASALSDELDPPRRSRWRARLTGADLAKRGRERAMVEIAAIRSADRTVGTPGEGGSRPNATDEGGRPEESRP